MGVLILERFHVQPQGFESPSAFSVIFDVESGPKQHFFVAENERHAKQWQTVLKKASYQSLRDKLINLQITLRQKTGCDPLRGRVLESVSDKKDFEMLFAKNGGERVLPKSQSPFYLKTTLLELANEKFSYL